MGEVTAKSDSVLIAYSDLRIANSKMIQLEYEKEINKKLRTIVANDSIVIKNYDTLNKELNKECKKTIKQRNICFGLFVVSFVAAIVLLVK